MTLDQFLERLDAKGPALADWPETERRAAEALLADSARARAALEAARSLDALLAETLVPEPAPARLRDAVAALPADHPRPAKAARSWSRGLQGFWRAGLAASLAAGLAGFLLGFTGLVEAPGLAPPEADLASLVYGVSDAGLRP